MLLVVRTSVGIELKFTAFDDVYLLFAYELSQDFVGMKYLFDQLSGNLGLKVLGPMAQEKGTTFHHTNAILQANS